MAPGVNDRIKTVTALREMESNEEPTADAEPIYMARSANNSKVPCYVPGHCTSHSVVFPVTFPGRLRELISSLVC